MRFDSLRPRLDPILPTVEKPGRYVGLERNVVRKDLPARAVTVALAFPDTYEIGMSHTGLKILYEIVNRREDFACERTYAPWVDLESRMRAERIPLFTVESFAPVADFDVVGFSLQSELNYSNVPNMLDLAGIPLHSADRGDDDPLVVAGGHAAFNPEPVADFLDAAVLGDGEEIALGALAIGDVPIHAHQAKDVSRTIAQRHLGGDMPSSLAAAVIRPAIESLTFPVKQRGSALHHRAVFGLQPFRQLSQFLLSPHEDIGLSRQAVWHADGRF